MIMAMESNLFKRESLPLKIVNIKVAMQAMELARGRSPFTQSWVIRT
jgi:hypothetical protein